MVGNMIIKYETLYKKFLSDKGEEPKSNDQLCKYCRKLIEQGTDPKTRLDVVREDGTLIFHVWEIGEAAKLKIKENEDIGPLYTKYIPMTKNIANKLRSR